MAIGIALATGACSASVPPPLPPVAHAISSHCSTPFATIAFDFEGASRSRCVIAGDREFRIVISPEHVPPINPSPWYAFRYETRSDGPLTIRLDYFAGTHRYPPKLTNASGTSVLTVEQSDQGKSVSFELPAGTGRVSGQEIFDLSRYEALYDRLARSPHVRRIKLGKSHDGYPITGLRLGSPDSPHLIVLLGRAHPPEVSGAVAMEAFLEQLAADFDQRKIDADRYQVLAVPLLNPDGVTRGHWRANLGGKDLNRDWGEFSQPETRAVGAWLEELESAVEPVVMIDFHSTHSNLFYVQGAGETDPAEECFLKDWLGRDLNGLEGYPFTIERRNANPGSGTSKNWFNARFGIPAYTFEVGDETDRASASAAARIFARTMWPALENMLREDKDHHLSRSQCRADALSGKDN